MADKIFHSTAVTFVDMTDSRTLDVYIVSNHPTVQIYDSNNTTSKYTPDWSVSSLILEGNCYLDAALVTPTTIEWYSKVGTTETLIGSSAKLFVSQNALADSPIITYICKATYDTITAYKEITFTRVDTGKNGTDGTSVRILGTAIAKASTTKPGYYEITYNEGAVTAANLGDAYIHQGEISSDELNGHLLVCTILNDNATSNDYFLDVGNIQGPAGQDAKNIIISGDSQMFKVSKSSTSTTPNIITINAIPINITDTSNITWSYRVNNSTSWLNLANGATDIEGGVDRSGNQVTVTGKDLASTITSLTFKAKYGNLEDIFTIYKVFDGTDGTPGAPGQSASMAFLTNENVTLSADANGVVTGGKSFTTNVVVYNGTQKDVLTVDNIGTITGIPEGITATKITSNNEVAITFQINALGSNLGSPNSNYGEITIPINSTSVNTSLKLNWSKVNAGIQGTSASFVDVTPSAYFFKSTKGKDGVFTPDYIYLYPRFQTVTYSKWQYYNDSMSSWVDVVSGFNGLTIGTYNSTANSLQIAKNSSLYTDSITSVSFRCVSSNTAVYDTVSIAKIYDVVDLQIGGRNLLLNSTGNLTTTTPWIGNFNYVGDGYDGQKAIRVVSTTADVVRQYAGQSILSRLDISDLGCLTLSFWYKANTGCSTAGVGAFLRISNTASQFNDVLNSTSKLILDGNWHYYTVTEDISRFNNTGVYDISLYVFSHKDNALYSNVKLEKGNKTTDWTPAPEDLINEASNVNVMLSNEAHFFEANASGVPTATSVVLDVFGYKGSIQSATTVGTITGLPSAGMTATITSNNTTSTKITISVTSSLTSAVADSGVLTIPVTVNGHTINKKFSWSKSKEGAVGTPGVDAVTFRIYSTEGYVLSTNTPSITLQTFAYVGDVAITAGATYQWYSYTNGAWTAITGSTNNHLSIARDDVSFSNGYMCKMMFGGIEYVDVVTIEDKSDNNQVFVSKPSNYSIGDIWIVSSDYIPPEMAEGVLLKAINANKTYSDADWITATAYDSRVQQLEKDVATYNNYFSFDTTSGIRISAKDKEGNVSPFSTTLSHTRLSFNQGAEAVAYIESNKMKIKEAEIESPLSVTGKKENGTVIQYPVLNIGNFSLIVESNGSLSIIANT